MIFVLLSNTIWFKIKKIKLNILYEPLPHLTDFLNNIFVKDQNFIYLCKSSDNPQTKLKSNFISKSWSKINACSMKLINRREESKLGSLESPINMLKLREETRHYLAEFFNESSFKND